MLCEESKEMMSLYIDDMLEDEDYKLFETHIEICDECKEELTLLRQIVNDINSLEMLTPPEDLRKELMEKIKLEANQKDFKVIPLSKKKREIKLNWKIASSIVAGFLMVLMAVETLDKKPELNEGLGTESMPKMAMQESMPSQDSEIDMASIGGSDPLEAGPKMRSFSAQIPNVYSLNIRTNDYGNALEDINELITDMGLQEQVTNEEAQGVVTGKISVLTISMDTKQKDEFVNQIKEMHINVTLEEPVEDSVVEVEGVIQTITLVVTVQEE